jgi:UDP-N-acetylmuramate--alanine ligase
VTRSAADVGAGLAPARAPRAVRPGERVHVVGIAGAGASAAALLAHTAGASVTGCDSGGPSPYSAAVEANGIEIEWRHDAGHIARWRPERLAVTKALTAVAPGHPELAAARAAGIAIEPWQQLVADVAVTTGQRLVAVAGTHGKSTTATWLVEMLAGAGRDPSAFVGALLTAALAGEVGRGHPATARWGRGADFIVEADEYAGNFDPFRPAVAVLVTAEWDHPDVFPDEDAVLDAFASWLRGIEGAGAPGSHDRPAIVANVGRAGVRGVLERLGDEAGPILPVALVDRVEDLETATATNAIRYATPSGGGSALAGVVTDVRPRETRLRIEGFPDGPAEVELRVPGRHNAENAMVVAGAALFLGLSRVEVISGLEAFTGASRRLELKGEVGGVAVLDDYGHHPTAITATIEAARQRYPGRRLWAVFEPLTYHRTAAMLDAFAGALAAADRVAVADIWAGRDPDTTIASPSALADAVNRGRTSIASATGSVEETAAHLAAQVRPGDVVVVMGGGRSYRIGELLLERLAVATSLD